MLEEASITEDMSDLRLFYCGLSWVKVKIWLHGDASVKVIGSKKHIWEAKNILIWGAEDCYH